MNYIKSILEVSSKECQSTIFDFIIIGSGAAGTATALTLAEKNYNILILEAGPLVITEHVGSLVIRKHPNILKSFCQKFCDTAIWESELSEHQEQVWSIAGGRTLFWGGNAPRFNQFDFDHWPKEFSKLDPDYKWAEKLLHVSNNFFKNETQNNLINQTNHNNINAMAAPLALEHQSYHQSTLPNLFCSSIHCLIKSRKFSININQNGIHLLCDSQAVKLNYENNKIINIEVFDSNHSNLFSLKAKNYILCGGALRSTKLVIDSNLNINSTLLGKKIGEHIFVKGLIKLDKSLSEPIYLYVPSNPKQPFMFEVHGPFTETWYDANYASVWLDWQKDSSYLLFYSFGVMEVREENILQNLPGKLGYKVYLNFSEQDQLVIKEIQQQAEVLAKALGGKVVNIEHQPPGSSLHERGGLIMGKDSATSVVSPQGKFWGYDNLYCFDSAIWPNQGAANSHLTITTIAHHLANKFNM